MVRKDILRTRILGSIGIVLCLFAFVMITFVLLQQPITTEPVLILENKSQEVINESNLTITATILEDKPKQKFLYILHQLTNTLSVVDLEKNETIKEIVLGKGSKEMFYDQPTNSLYITNKASNTISVVSLDKQMIVRTLKGGNSPEGIAVTDKKIYVTNPGDQVVLMIDKILGSIDKEIRVGEDPSHMILNADQRKLYVLNRGSDDITTINTNIDAFIDTWFAGNAPERFAMSPYEKFIYVSNLNGLITILPLRHPNEYGEMRVGLSASEMAFTPNNVLAIVVKSDENSIALTSLTQNMLLATIDVGVNPSDVVITKDGNTAYVSNADSNTISIINLQQKTRVAEFPVNKDPQRLFLKEN